jgi:hypothetical protein
MKKEIKERLNPNPNSVGATTMRISCSSQNIQKLNNVSKNVLTIASLFPSVRENYNLLTAYYWAIYDDVSQVHEVVNATPSETITRCFRKLVETGLIEVPERTKKKRLALAEKYAKTYANDFSNLL